MKKIVWLLSLILCLATFFIAPSAQADEPFIVKQVSEFKVQGGEFAKGTLTDQKTWPLYQERGIGEPGERGERIFTAHVDFKEPYQQTPVVVVAVSGIDVSPSNRFKVTPINVTKKGFDIEYKTWADGSIWNIFVNWTAFGGK